MTPRRLCIGLVLLGASCTTPPPRIPFDPSEGFHASVVSSTRWSDDHWHSSYNTIGIDIVTQVPGTGGWGWELGGRFASDTGTASREVVYFPDGGVKTRGSAESERASDFYELTIGTRQTFFPGARLQPWVSVGTALVNIKHVDQLDKSTLPPLDPGKAQPDAVEHFEDTGLGIYLRAGLRWNVLRDQVREKTEGIVTLDVRGLYGEEYSFIELSLGIGFGR